ncbi:MAG: TrkH family potassium uptake protein [Planctomycetota bacterium]|jgi:trk system potassium uptake protein TrkH
MNLRLTLKVQGWLLLFLAGMLLTPIPFSIYYADGAVLSFLVSATVSALVGYVLVRRFEAKEGFTLRDGFGVVTLSWLVFALFGALPFLLSGHPADPIDAFFESMSGFTTTGSTVIEDLDLVPRSVLYWRALTQWLGGMGIIVLSLAILPVLGVGGMQLFEAEVPGPTSDRLRPRIQDTAKLLWGVYLVITAAETILLMLGGMSFYEAVCHSFTTMATGGFSTQNASVGHFDSNYIHVVITFFMFLAGTNFSLHYHAMRGRVLGYFKSEEFRFYGTILLGSIVILFLFNLGRYEGGLENLRDSAFQATSIMTTTGFGTADYELWAPISQLLLIALMFLGGCAGSTGGGMKNARVLLLLKHSVAQMSRLIHPRQVRTLKLDQKPVGNDVIQSILGFFALYVGIFLLATLAMAAMLPDVVTSGASVVACLSNIGPGLGSVGPTDTYAHIPHLGKIILSICMLVGRLEVFTVLVLVFPTFWRK